MATAQGTLPFRVRKKATLNFYASKQDDTAGLKQSEVTVRKEYVAPVYSPKVKKLVELDSDDENIDLTNISHRSRRAKKRPHVINEDSDTETSDSECSPTKISKMREKSKLKITPKMLHNSLTQNVPECDINETGNQNRHNARVALHTLTSTSLPGRKDELDRLETFLTSHLENETSGTLYVSGPPGTGKTACLSNILQRPKFKQGFRPVYVNCTTMRSAGSVFGRICQELHLKTTGHTEKSYLKAIDKHLASKHGMILLVLDEIDQLCNKKQSVLYTIFEWPSLPKSKIVLVGIANALDLTDRILPRLQTRLELKPELMHFAPYTKQQIIEIFSERLKEEVALDTFSPIAIQMLAGKVAAICGDIRRALDIGRRVVELATARGAPGKRLSTTVELKQVMEVLGDVYGASQKLKEEMDESFPLQQKLLICSLLLMLGKGKNKDITMGKLHDTYKRVCKKRNIVPLDSAEFVGLCGLVETRGIIRLSGKKEPRTQKVVLQWDESEVGNALSDKQLISDVINDVSCLP